MMDTFRSVQKWPSNIFLCDLTDGWSFLDPPTFRRHKIFYISPTHLFVHQRDGFYEVSISD